MINVFCGSDPREEVGRSVFLRSLFARASTPVAVTPLGSVGLQEGSNQFTKSRFLVPYLMGFQGRAVFLDGADMIMQADIAELLKLFDPACALQVVKHDYKTRHPRKYVGTAMESGNQDYARKNWASVMLINCAHPAWTWATYGQVQATSMGDLLTFSRFFDRHIGTLPKEWNVLVDEGQPAQGAKVLHWTAGIPAFPAYADAPAADRWVLERERMLEATK